MATSSGFPVLPYGAEPGERTGTATFRLMPTDDFVTRPASVQVVPVAAGRALQLTYTWQHPDDGDQAGTLLVGAPGEDGVVSAAWVDSWHQQDVTALAGRGTATGAVMGYDYAPGWRWELEVEVTDGVPCLVMRNVVPAGEHGPGGAYEVSRSDWR